jgi:predicted TIM-barrel fold metal-dependent hydrolase
MGMLSDEELARLSSAESLFPSPIPVQSISSDEFMPGPQTPRQREFEGRVKDLGAQMAKRLGMSRRRFFQTAAGMAAAFVAMNETYGPLFGVSRAEAATPEQANARAKKLSGQFIMDMHTHFLRPGTKIQTFVRQRKAVGKAGWNPALNRDQTIEDLMFANYLKEIYLDSDTKVACISGAPSENPDDWFLTNEMKAQARADVNGLAGTKRMFAHAIFTPGYPGWMESIDHALAELKPDSMKGYTIGDNTNKNLSKHPWRLDDEKLVYPAYAKFLKAGLKNVCVHKGLFPPDIEKQYPHLLEYCDVRDVGKAAKDWPQMNFIVYHGGYRWQGGEATVDDAWQQLERTGRVEWITDLAEIPAKYGVKNVYADVGQLFAQSTIADPRVAAVMMGQLIKGLGVDHVCWGTDAIWTGSPQWQIEALRRLEIPEELQKKYSLAPLGPADGPVKNAIFGGNNARLYNYKPELHAELEHDKLSRYKEQYAEAGAEPTNLAYGYVLKPA